MQLPAIYGQRDVRWAALQLGSLPLPSSSIGAYGCYVASDAMLAAYFGHPVTPPELNARFLERRAYVQGNLLPDSALNLAFPDCVYVASLNYYGGPADLDRLRDLLADPTLAVILELDFDHDPTDGIQTHFVVATACDGAEVTIADPWYGTQDNLTDHYGPDPARVIQKFVLYRGTPAPERPQEESAVTDEERQNLQALQAELDLQRGINRTLQDQLDAVRDMLAADDSALGALRVNLIPALQAQQAQTSSSAASDAHARLQRIKEIVDAAT